MSLRCSIDNALAFAVDCLAFAFMYMFWFSISLCPLGLTALAVYYFQTNDAEEAKILLGTAFVMIGVAILCRWMARGILRKRRGITVFSGFTLAGAGLWCMIMFLNLGISSRWSVFSFAVLLLFSAVILLVWAIRTRPSGWGQ